MLTIALGVVLGLVGFALLPAVLELLWALRWVWASLALLAVLAVIVVLA